MTNERKQVDLHCARQWYLAGKYLGRALVSTVMLVCRSLRGIVHFAFVPHEWYPKRWQRSPLAQASTRLAHASVDAVLVVLPIGLVVGLLW